MKSKVVWRYINQLEILPPGGVSGQVKIRTNRDSKQIYKYRFRQSSSGGQEQFGDSAINW